jgi:type I restriction enzyme S subunit
MRWQELGKLCAIKSGGTPSRKQNDYWGGEIPWAKISDLDTPDGGPLKFTEERISSQGLEAIRNRIFPVGTILLAIYGSVGKTAVLGVESSCNQAILGIQIEDAEALDPEYLLFWLRSVAEKLMSQAKGVAQKNISLKQVKELKIPLPPLEEQKRIAAILDEADRVRKKTQALIDKYDELAQSLFLDMFGDPVTNPKGWEVKPLGKLAHMKAGKFVRASDIIEECDEGMNPCYGGNGLRGFVESTTHEGEFVLIGRQGALCGNVKLVKGLFHATEHAVVCTPSLSYESEWFYHLLVMLDLNRFATGAAQPGLNVGTLNEVSVPYPPQELQQSFSLMIKNLTAQKELTDQGSQESQEIFQALLQKAFKGELT